MKINKAFIVGSVIAVSLCLLVGGVSGYITRMAIPVWYADLKKPFFTPPNGLFAPVWTTLYILMGIAAGGVWAKGLHHRWVKTALYHFAAQLVVNALWTLAFFGLKRPELGLVVIIALLVLIERCIHWFKIVNRNMAFILYPYFAWVLFATFLNAGIVYLNQ